MTILITYTVSQKHATNFLFIRLLNVDRSSNFFTCALHGKKRK